jgi:hypothetical protein
MATDLELKASAGGWNPYCLAYALETGCSDPDEAFARDGNNIGYMEWNSDRWNEFMDLRGLPRSSRWALSDEDREDFMRYLNERITTKQ